MHAPIRITETEVTLTRKNYDAALAALEDVAVLLTGINSNDLSDLSTALFHIGEAEGRLGK